MIARLGQNLNIICHFLQSRGKDKALLQIGFNKINGNDEFIRDKCVGKFYHLQSKAIAPSTKEKNMTVELKPKGALVLPQQIVKKMKLAKGDLFDVVEVDGVITLTPIVVTPKKDYLAMEKELNALRAAKEKAEAAKAASEEAPSEE